MTGILCTFGGIIYALLDLDTLNISGSMPKLLNGLSVAFVPSAVAIAITIGWNLWPKKNETESEKWTDDLLKDISSKMSELIEKQKTLENLPLIREGLTKEQDINSSLLKWVQHMLEVQREIKESNEKNFWDIINGIKVLELLPKIDKELESINTHIWWNDDMSLLDGVQQLQCSTAEKQDNLKKSFDEFAREMSENNMKALTESMQQFMEDFNAKINDQLWQSFQDLKSSIDHLLEWQVQYKVNIITSMEALNLSKESLEKSSKGFEITVEKSETFIGVADSLKNELHSLNESLIILKSGLNEFDGIATNNKESSQKIIESIDALKNNFVSKAEVMVEESEKHISNMQATFATQAKDLTETHQDMLQDLKNNVDNTNKKISEQLERIGTDLEKQTDKLGERTVQLDNDIGEALNKSLDSLWSELTSITEKFTEQLARLNSILQTKE